jgi:hypothetical protein
MSQRPASCSGNSPILEQEASKNDKTTGVIYMDINEDIYTPKRYQIRVKGVLDSKWTSWFEGFTIQQDRDDTLITGQISDQAALRAVLNKLWDLNMILISINPFNKEN